MIKRTIILPVLILIMFMNSGCSDNGVQPSQVPVEYDLKVLFIGNSYLGYFNVPVTVRNMAAASGKNIYVQSAIKYGHSLYQLINDSWIISNLESQDWNYVVFQDGGHTIAYQDSLKIIMPWIDYHPLYDTIDTLSQKIRENYSSTIPVYMMAWGYKDGLTWVSGRSDTFEDMSLRIYDNTIEFADSLDLTIAPAGWAWYKVWQEKPEIELFDADMHHAAIGGAYLTSCVIHNVIFQDSLDHIDLFDEIHPDVEKYLQGAANRVVFENPEIWRLKK
ncbi:hypothetical protein ACFL5P_02460 [candidate division KSB1 bacterium]